MECCFSRLKAALTGPAPTWMTVNWMERGALGEVVFDSRAFGWKYFWGEILWFSEVSHSFC